jgi:hypothetical protein
MLGAHTLGASKANVVRWASLEQGHRTLQIQEPGLAMHRRGTVPKAETWMRAIGATWNRRLRRLKAFLEGED